VISKGCRMDLGLGPGCAREGVVGLQEADASHWAEGSYSSMQDYDSLIIAPASWLFSNGCCQSNGLAATNVMIA
jgi:hypothetical protein